LGRTRRLGQRLLVSLLLRHVVAGGETNPRLLVREDRRAGGAERLVAADLVEVPMRVEQGRNAAAGQIADGRRDGIAMCGRAAVDDDLACARLEHEDVAARAAQKREAARNLRAPDLFSREAARSDREPG